MDKLCFTFLLLFFHHFIFGQVIVKPSEKLIYSFETTNKKTVLIVVDTVHYKVIYRFGTKTATELEISHDTSSAEYDDVDTNDYRNTFSYNFYSRWGGPSNLGENINYFEFINNGFYYSVYSEYNSIGNHTDIGVRVTNLQTKKETEIKGILKTQKGSLDEFRYNKLVVITTGQR